MIKSLLSLAVMMVLICGFSHAADLPLYTATLNYDNQFKSPDGKFYASFSSVNWYPANKAISLPPKISDPNSQINVITDGVVPPLTAGRYRVTVYYTNSAPVALNFYTAAVTAQVFTAATNLIAQCSFPTAVSALNTAQCGVDVPLNAKGHIDVVIQNAAPSSPWITAITIQRFADLPKPIASPLINSLNP